MEFFIPETHYCGRRHYRHATLLIGYEPRTGCFKQVSYRASGAFCAGDIRAEALVTAMNLERHGLVLRPESRPDCCRSEKIAFQEIEPTPARVGPADFSLIRRQLENYLAGRGEANWYGRGGQCGIPGRETDFHGEEGAYGMAIYPMFATYIERAAFDGRRIDPRATRILLEHKGLVGRILRLVGEGGTSRGWPIDFGAVEAIAARINMMTGIFNLTIRRDIAQQIAATLDELKRLESTMLTAALAAWPSSPTF
jgi:hypothetical protein